LQDSGLEELDDEDGFFSDYNMGQEIFFAEETEDSDELDEYPDYIFDPMLFEFTATQQEDQELFDWYDSFSLSSHFLQELPRFSPVLTNALPFSFAPVSWILSYGKFFCWVCFLLIFLFLCIIDSSCFFFIVY